MKLGTVDKLKSLSYGNYSTLLKKELPALASAVEPTEYLLLSGTQLPWKEGANSPEQPLFYVGDTKQWIKWLKTQKKITLNDYSYGVCKVQMNGEKADVQLLPEKGKLAKPATLKPIQKVFKGMKPKVFFELVESLEGTASGGTAPRTTEAPLSLNGKYHQELSKEQYFLESSLEDLQTPKEIDQHIRDFSAKVKQWESDLAKAKEKPSKELQEIKGYLAKTIKDWKQLRPLYSDWLNKKEILEKEGFSEKRYQDLVEANKKIQKYA